MQRLNDWLQEHHTLVAIMGPGGSALCALGVRYAPNGWVIALLLVLLALCASAPTLAARVNRLQQGRRAAEDCTRRLLQACAHSFGHPGVHVRANIMKFSANLQRRKVHAATAFNMENDPDCDLEIDATAGVSGQAAVNRRPAFGDISLPLQPGGPDWGLRDAEKAAYSPKLENHPERSRVQSGRSEWSTSCDAANRQRFALDRNRFRSRAKMAHSRTIR